MLTMFHFFGAAEKVPSAEDCVQFSQKSIFDPVLDRHLLNEGQELEFYVHLSCNL